MYVGQEINRYLARIENSAGKRIPQAQHENMMNYYDYLSNNLMGLVPGELEYYKLLTLAMGKWFSHLATRDKWGDERDGQRRDLGRALGPRYQRLNALGDKRTQAQAEEWDRLNIAYRRRLGATLGYYLEDASEAKEVGAILGLPVEVKRFDVIDIAFKEAGSAPVGVAI